MAVQQAVRMRPNDLFNNGASGIATNYSKYELDSGFSELQIFVGSKVASGTPGEYKVQVAVTDEAGVDTVAKAFLPRRNGVTYNDKSAFGWKDCTFGGAASKQIGLAPSNDGKSVIHMSTDTVLLDSIARADGKPGFFLLVKVVQINSTGAYTQEANSNALWGNVRTLNKPWYRELFSTKRSNVDGITNLTSIPTGVTPGNSGYTMMSFPVTNTIGPVNPELVLFTGDSRKSAAYSTYQFNNPNWQSLMSLSTPARPISVVNAAGSGHDHTQYLQVARDMITTGLRPTIIYMPGFSQNGFKSFATFKTLNDGFMAWVRAIPGLENVKFVLDTDYYTGGYTGTTESNRQQCVAYAKSLANGTTVFCFDSDSIITDYRTPSAPVLRTALMHGDGVHANQMGQDYMTYGGGPNPGLVALYASVLNSSVVVLPGAPAIGSATAGSKSASVTGTAPTSTGGGEIIGYRATSTPGGFTGTSATLPVTVTGLGDATAYTFTLAAQTSAGYGPESLASNSVTTDAEIRLKPIQFQIDEVENLEVTMLAKMKTLSYLASSNENITASVKRVRGLKYSVTAQSNHGLTVKRVKSIAANIAEIYGCSISIEVEGGTPPEDKVIHSFEVTLNLRSQEFTWTVRDTADEVELELGGLIKANVRSED